MGKVKDEAGKVVIPLSKLASDNAAWLTKLFNATKASIKKDREEAEQALKGKVEE